MIKGLLLVLSAPSGAGKSTLCQELLKRLPTLFLSVSCTTRPPRSAEANGRDYHFMAPEEFERRLKAQEFIESARVHDFLYGTLKAPVEKALVEGRDVLLNIDTQGAQAVKGHFPDCLRLFLLPPSWAELEKRLRGRAQDGEGVIQKRLANARGEVSRLTEYDYAVVNDRLEDAVDDVMAVLRAEKRRLPRMAEALENLEFISRRKP